MGMLMGGWNTYGQSLSDARAVGAPAYSPLVRDLRGFTHNPAGLTGIRDWDFSTTTFFPTGQNGGFVFHSLGFGKRFSESHAVGVKFTPGSILEFSIPSSVVQVDSTAVTIEQRLIYDERFALGYAVQPVPSVSAGVTLRQRSEEVRDTQYKLIENDTSAVITTSAVSNQSSLATLDAGLLWDVARGLRVSVVGRNLFTLRGKEFPQALRGLQLPVHSIAEFGVAFQHGGVTVAATVVSDRSGALSSEIVGFGGIEVRGGLHWGSVGTPFVSAVTGGVGWTHDVFSIDVGYVHFLNQETRTRSTPLSRFDATTITNVDISPYTQDRMVFSVRAMFGETRERVVHIEGVNVTSGVYPSAYELLSYRPLGTVRVRNVSQKPVHARASLFIERYMDAPTESDVVVILPEEVAEIPLTAVFNDRILDVTSLLVREGNVYVSASRARAEEYDDRVQTKVVIYGRNDWNGDVHGLRNFVTPNHPDILRYGRDVLLEHRDSLQDVPKSLLAFTKARLLINSFAGKLLYLSDPRQSTDYVQFPNETLGLKGGDCDDMTVLFSSLLNSIGISTALVDVVPPENPEESHIYLLFDTGLDPRYGVNISENPKRYLTRKNRNGAETIWIPVETTIITRGFDEAWSLGAQEYFDDVEVGLGVVKGWVRVVDVY